MTKTAKEFLKNKYGSIDLSALTIRDEKLITEAMQEYSDHVLAPLKEENERLKKELQENEWINAKKYLPENNQQVLVINKEGLYKICDYLDDDFYHFFVKQPAVTHWQPLPDKPGKEEK